jgi:hypothetical protein
VPERERRQSTPPTRSTGTTGQSSGPGRSDQPQASVFEQPRARLGAIIAAAIVVGILIWLLVGGDDDSNNASTTTASGSGPVALTAGTLASTAQDLGQPIYWAGPKPGRTYEYTQTADGTIYVRYLPPGVDVGDSSANYLIVATYPFPDALAGLQAVSNGKAIDLPGGGIAVVDQGYPKSVHLAFPGVDYQVEVYDPSPERAREVATSGDIAPVG